MIFEKLKIFIKKHKIIILIFVLILYTLFHTRKCYYLKGYETQNFPKEQLYELERTDSVLNINQMGFMFLKKNNLEFFLFTREDCKILIIENIILQYDGKIKNIKYGLEYRTDTKNQNNEKILFYNLGEKEIKGYYKYISTDFFTNNKICWINFYKFFKWKHWRLGSEFPLKMIVHYKLDDREYEQELNFTVSCEKDFPVNWFMAIFGG